MGEEMPEGQIKAIKFFSFPLLLMSGILIIKFFFFDQKGKTMVCVHFPTYLCLHVPACLPSLPTRLDCTQPCCGMLGMTWNCQ